MIFVGDALEKLRDLDPDSVDSIVTDPPYGLSFMGKNWDHGVPGESFWTEALRVAKPGAHLLAFGGTRTYHRLACAIEDAGWEIRDCIMWVYGSGFPKSLDISKAIDKAAGAKREVVGYRLDPETGRSQGTEPHAQRGRNNSILGRDDRPVEISKMITAPSTDAAKQWAGWGTALKPAYEPIIVARKPFKGPVYRNVLEHGTGALNIDGCRVHLAANEDPKALAARSGGVRGFADQYVGGKARGAPPIDMSAGRWPANLIHDGSEEVVALFPEGKSGGGRNGEPGKRNYDSAAKSNALSGDRGGLGVTGEKYFDPERNEHFTFSIARGDSGSAARYFYCAKASKADRGEGNSHPTVKPNALMRYLVRLVTPPGGIVLDPFMGSGSTGKAAIEEGFDFIGIEKDAESFATAARRFKEALARDLPLFRLHAIGEFEVSK